MSKFKVGDRVICNDSNWKNVIGTIIEDDKKSVPYKVVSDEGRVSWFEQAELKLVKETPQRSLRSTKQRYLVESRVDDNIWVCSDLESVMETLWEDGFTPDKINIYKLGPEVKLSLEEINDDKNPK